MEKEPAASAQEGESGPDPLIVALRGGSATALSRMAEECALDLLPQLRSRLGRRSLLGIEAEDVLQDAFLRAIARLQDFQGDTRREFKTWLFRIAINRLFDAFRAAGRERQREGRIVFTDLATVEEPRTGCASSPCSRSTAVHGSPQKAMHVLVREQPEALGVFAIRGRDQLLDGARRVGDAERGQREALVLRDLMTLSWDSLGFLTGRTPEGTRSLYYRARRAARSQADF